MLDLNDLTTGDNPGITAEKGAELAQAGAVCLESQGHQQGAALNIRGDVPTSVLPLIWPPVTPQASRTWFDTDEATEDGAAGIAILLVNREIGQQVILRSYKGTGFDYWLGDENTTNASDTELAATQSLAPILDDAKLVARSRMEVSGIRNGDDVIVRTRVERKLRQMDRSDTTGLPGYAAVVEFGRPLAEVRRK